MKRILIFALMLTWMNAAFGASETDRDTLKGLMSFFVLVETPNVNAQSTGLTKERLQTDVELRLRKAGLPIRDSAPQYLYVNIAVLPLENYSGKRNGNYLYTVNVDFCQSAILSRDKSIMAFGATTWKVGGRYGYVPAGIDVKKVVREAVGDGVDEFINDYLTENPIERTK